MVHKRRNARTLACVKPFVLGEAYHDTRYVEAPTPVQLKALADDLGFGMSERISLNPRSSSGRLA
jgi:hypothetical protein